MYLLAGAAAGARPQLHPRDARPRGVRRSAATSARPSCSATSSPTRPTATTRTTRSRAACRRWDAGKRRGVTCGWPAPCTRQRDLPAAPRRRRLSGQPGSAPRTPATGGGSGRAGGGGGGPAGGGSVRAGAAADRPRPRPALRRRRPAAAGPAPAASASGPTCAIASRTAMRCWMGGCVSNTPVDLFGLLAAGWRCRGAPSPGWRGAAGAGRRRCASSARARPSGLRVSSTAEASARYSRRREIANCTA